MIFLSNSFYYPPGMDSAPLGPPPGPAPIQQSRVKRIYVHKSTSNKSFLDMHMYLKSLGIKNNAFMLALIDPDLAGVSPFDPTLNSYMKQKILMECLTNYFYWLREVVRLPSPGTSPMKFRLDRGNLAFNFCSMLNLNIFFEEPRLIITYWLGD